MRFIQLFSIALILSLATSLSVKASQPLTFEDVMKFRQIEQTKISENGQWIALSTEPDRGDSEGLLYSASSQSKFSVERGIQPQLSKNGNFALFKQDFSLVDKTNIKPKLRYTYIMRSKINAVYYNCIMLILFSWGTYSEDGETQTNWSDFLSHSHTATGNMRIYQAH